MLKETAMNKASEAPETQMEAKWTIRLARIAEWFALGLVVAGLVHLGFIRPWYLNWGATGEEITRTWPGDELAPQPVSLATRALTINAPVTEVWPWIVQIGQDRGGCYSYTWLENLFFADMHNTDRIHPEWQTREVGDTVWLARKDRYGGRGRVVVAALDPNRAMVLASPSDAERISTGGRAKGGTWTFILEPIDDHTTRLILRSRGAQDESFAAMLLVRLVFDPVHFIMERKMMLGIKQRAEGTNRATNP
ncbi:MAG: hypothetical protein ACLQVM_21585 [Terriglobia bacterium]